MKIFFGAIFLLFLAIRFSIAQQPESRPVVTFKTSFYISGIYGVDYRDDMLDKTVFVQPAFGLGFTVKNWFYIGAFSSKYQWFEYDGTFGHSREIFAADLGYPLHGKHILGLTFGKEDYYAPSKGMLLTTYSYESYLFGVFFEYRLIKYISVPIKIDITRDSKDYGFGTYWHFSIGISGNLPIPLQSDW